MFTPGTTELIIILIIVLIIFGAGKLPKIGEGLGKGITNFRRATRMKDEIDVTPDKESKAEEVEAKESEGDEGRN